MSRGLVPPPIRDLPPGRHDHVKEIVMKTIDKPVRTRRRRRRLVVMTAGLAIALLGTSAVQAARSGLTLEDVINNPTLLFGRDGSVRESLVGLYPELEVAPDEADAAIDRLGDDIALPPGGSWYLIRGWFEANPTYIDELGLRSMLEFNAACQWTGFWLDAVDRDDTAAAGLAVAALSAIPDSPVLNVTSRGETTARMQRIADDASAGDTTWIREFWSINCDPGGPPPGE